MMDPLSRVSASRIGQYLRPYVLKGLGVLALVLATISLGLLQPLITRVLIDDVLLNGRRELLLGVIGVLGGVIIIRAGIGIVAHYLYMRVGQLIMVDIRRQLYEHTHRLSLDEVQRRPAGEIMSRILNDVGALQTILTTYVMQAITNSLMLVVIAVILLFMDWQLALVSFITLPCLVVVARSFGRPVKESSYWVQRRIADMSSFLQESLQAFFLVRTMSREQYQQDRFGRLLSVHAQTVLRAGVWQVAASQTVSAVGAIGPIILLWLGSIRVLDGLLTLGTLIAFFTYLTQMYGPLQSLTQLNVSLQGTLASVERIFGFLDLPTDVAERESRLDLTDVRGEVEFDAVGFSRGRRQVLRDVSVRFEPGTLTAVVGPSGAGKSTMAHLLLRLHDPTAGRILIDGQDISEVRPSSLRRSVVLIPQEVFLFNSSVRENIRFGYPDATDADVERACLAAGIHDVVSGMPDGYDSVIGERGVTMSGGERQRLALARAVLADPKVLILDEATSSLDASAEREIWSTLQDVARDRTTIVITHRPTSFVRADTVVVINDGEVAAVGPHDDLTAKCALYVRLCGTSDPEERGS